VEEILRRDHGLSDYMGCWGAWQLRWASLQLLYSSRKPYPMAQNQISIPHGEEMKSLATFEQERLRLRLRYLLDMVGLSVCDMRSLLADFESKDSH
jgi:hypothetical protein